MATFASNAVYMSSPRQIAEKRCSAYTVNSRNAIFSATYFHRFTFVRVRFHMPFVTLIKNVINIGL